MENDALQEKLKCNEMELKHSKSREKELQHQLVFKEKDINNMLGESHKLTNMLLHHKLGFGEDNHNRENNKPHEFFKAST